MPRTANVKGGGIWTAKGFLFELSGGHLALDFANTLDNRPTLAARELLTGFADLISWAEQAKLLARPEAVRLRELARRRPEDAEALLRRAVRAREALYAIFSAIARRGKAPRDALRLLNAELPRSLRRLSVRSGRRGFEWAWQGIGSELDCVLWPVLRSAAELLVSTDLSRVRECTSPDCGWLFLDRSRSGSRRWCDMSVCGNRAKARRHYRRAREARAQ